MHKLDRRIESKEISALLLVLTLQRVYEREVNIMRIKQIFARETKEKPKVYHFYKCEVCGCKFGFYSPRTNMNLFCPNCGNRQYRQVDLEKIPNSFKSTN